MISPALCALVPRRESTTPRPRRRRAVGLLAIAPILVFALGAAALAYFLSAGAGTGSAAVSTLNAPAITSATPGAGTVQLSWSAVPPPLGLGTVTYHVSRDGGAPGGDCPTVAAPTTVTSCTDSGLSAGTYGYTVTAHWRTWTATSATTSVSVASGAATHLVLSAAMTTVSAGQANALTITAKDASSNTVTAYTGDKSLTFTGAGTIGSYTPTVTDKTGTARNFGTAETITFSSGVASVSGASNGVMTLYKAETASIVVSDGSISNGAGLPVTVTAATAAKLAFTQQPSSSTAGVAFATQPQVTVQDQFANTVTTYTGNVTLAIGTNPGGGTLSCTTNPLAASGGVATFSGCRINNAGTGYTLTATSGSLTSATSIAFNVTATSPIWVATGSTVVRTSNGDLTPPIPGSLNVNDLMLLIVANTKQNVSSAPTGWTEVATVGVPTGADVSLSVFYRFFQTGDTAPAVGVNTDAGGASARIVVYRNVNTTTPLDVAAATGTSAAGQSTFTPPGLTTVSANARAESIVAENSGTATAPTLSFSNAQGFSAESGFPQQPPVGDTGNHHAVFVAGKGIPSPGPVTFPTYATNLSGVWAGISIALRP